MHYSELIQFENLETVIQFQQTNRIEQLVKTYVISDEMASKFNNLIFEQLRFNQVGDKKGLFIIGNYGTGKSHLMAVISSIAENATLLKQLNNKAVAKAAKPSIAGKFHLIRVEMSAVERSLRLCLTEEIENYLNKIGVDYKFPPADKITNNKAAFQEMMAAFEAAYPKHGLLLVVDELLEFLSSRKDRALILDLSFLREIGEICQDSRFRFIAGLQETVFENPRFKFAANELRRVKDRFEQVLITRKDIKFVVSERLLKKTAKQKQIIRDYLEPFAKYYSSMNERMDEFVELFPVHPDYLDVFESILVVEQREVLKTLERAMQALLNEEIPETEPKLLAYDSYWKTLRENFSFRASDEIREIINCSQVLEDRIERAFTRPSYKPMALKIIHALSVHRLTTHDFYSAVGVTAQELRDSLCLYQAGLEDLGNPADDLLSQVELVLREILKTVNRQFISANPSNGQYYLDLKKTEDFDAIIENRAEIVENNELDRYYYAVLRQVLEVTDEPYLGDFLIWEHELEWLSHKVTRNGYLFFGTPNERATAVPEQIFYIYFIQAYEPPKYKKSAAEADEVFFHLKNRDENFDKALRYYTAASILVASASGHPKSVYEAKAKKYFQQVVQWLQSHLTQAFQVTYQGRTQALLNWTKGNNVRDLAGLAQDERINFSEITNLVASLCLEKYFSKITPNYPVFPILITRYNRNQAAEEALRGIASEKRSKQANGVLDALQLLEEAQNSPYASYILEKLHQKPEGQVLNRHDFLAEDRLSPYQLEAEFVIVVLAALVYSGELVLALPGQKFNASNFKELVDTPINDLLAFKHLERPKAFNMSALKALFNLLGLSSGLAVELTQNKKAAVEQLQIEVNHRLMEFVKIQETFLSNGVIFWGKAVLTEAEIQAYRDNFSEARSFLESLQAYSSPGQFKNFRYSSTEVTAQLALFDLLEEVKLLQSILSELNQAATYLITAESILPADDGWIVEMKKQRKMLLSRLADKTERAKSGFSYHLQQSLGTLQQTYRQIYLGLHKQARLDKEEDEEKQALLMDARFIALKNLAQISLLPQKQLIDFETELNQLESCVDLVEYDLLAQAFCPHCEFKAIFQQETAASEKLITASENLHALYEEWTDTLLNELKTVKESEQWILIESDKRVLLETFLKDENLPEEISSEFLAAVEEALSGLEKVSLNFDNLQDSIIAGGFPVTLMELQRRIDRYLQETTQGKNPHKIRIVLE
jgi:hypothetical protein